MNDFELLVFKGNIGFYNCCEIIEIYIYNNSSNEDYNLYTILTFKEDDFFINRTITKKFINITNNIKIGIKQYCLSIENVQKNYDELINGNWISTHKEEDKSYTNYSHLKIMNKQYVSSNDNIRLNNGLKNNFFNGSYILEFFDEKKEFDYLFNDKNKFKRKCEEIKQLTHINLYNLKDRLGNFIFQFPIDILETQHTHNTHNNSITFDFAWHEKVKEYPDCLIHIESELEKTCVEYQIKEYDKNLTQEIIINRDFYPFKARIFRTDCNLLLYYNNLTLSGVTIHQPDTSTLKTRKFKINNEPVEVNLFNSTQHTRKNYSDYIQSSINHIEESILEKKLLLKKYPQKDKQTNNLIIKNCFKDIQMLIKWYGSNGTWLWDPYLRSNDILNTLFYSPWNNVKLKALGMPNNDTVKILQIDYSDNDENERNYGKLTKHQYHLKKEFDNIESNFEGLNFEYKSDVEGNSHDRFLIFPGNSEKYIEPTVFSLGISINQYGKKHHILQKVLYPEQIIDEFEKKWKKGFTVWKYPK